MFGIMAHYIATEFAAKSEIHNQAEFSREKAAELSGQLMGKTIQQANSILHQQNRHSNLPIFLIDHTGKVISATNPLQNIDIGYVNQYLAKQPYGKHGGTIGLEAGEFMWGLAEVPGTPYRLVLFHGKDRDVSFFGALGIKLLVAAFFIIWVTTWGAIILANVISQRLDKQNAILVHQTLHDQLTDLPNRNLLFDRLQQAIFHARRINQPVALFLIELRNIKEINDTLGHQSGDILLKQIGPRLINTLRDSDSVARLDGGEFAILTPGLEKQHVPLLVNKISHALEQPFIINQMEFETSVAIGVALFPEHSDDANKLYQQADVAMCLAKSHSDKYFIYDTKSDPHSIEQLTLMADLRQAITNNELQLYYQPKIDLSTQKVIGAEALIRWFHPQRGLIMPDDFIPKAEQSGLIRPLTRWIIEKALKQSAEWNKRGIPLQVAINVSQRSLYDCELLNQIADTMQKLHITYCSLDIEITETAIMAHPEQSMATLQMLHDMGIHLSIDDFGTGFTSLAYLKELPVDELKIDKSFIMSMLDDSEDVMIVRSIIELAHSLGRVVVAEGVESKEILQLLQSLNCDTAQGYYMSKPLPSQEFELWLSSSEWNPLGDQSSTA